MHRSEGTFPDVAALIKMVGCGGPDQTAGTRKLGHESLCYIITNTSYFSVVNAGLCRYAHDHIPTRLCTILHTIHSR